MENINVPSASVLMHRDKAIKAIQELYSKLKSSPGGEVPPATKDSPGIVKVGNNIDVNSEGTISIPLASASQAGVTRLSGEAVTEGTAPNYSAISSYGGTAMVRKATTDTFGVVQIGDGLTVNNGTISVSSSGFAKFVGYYHNELYGDFSSAEEIQAFLEGCKGVVYVAPDDTECNNAHLVINWQVGSSGISLYYMDPLDLGSTGGLKSILIYWSSTP